MSTAKLVFGNRLLPTTLVVSADEAHCTYSTKERTKHSTYTISATFWVFTPSSLSALGTHSTELNLRNSFRATPLPYI